jgi:hypothetical protein
MLISCFTQTRLCPTEQWEQLKRFNLFPSSLESQHLIGILKTAVERKFLTGDRL